MFLSHARYVFSVNHYSDEQLELLNLLLQEELPQQSQQDARHNSSHLSEEVEQKLQNPRHNEVTTEIEIRPDPGRERRKRTPEVIFGETKGVAQIIAMAQGLLRGSGRAIVSRVQPEAIGPLQVAFQGYTIRVHEAARAVVIYRPDFVRPHSGGHVGVISAGTSDIPVAEEAVLIAEEMGCRVSCIYDVGVAGLHRLMGPLRGLLFAEVDVIIVAAGMDG